MAGAQAEWPQLPAIDFIAGRSVTAGQQNIYWDLDCASGAAIRSAPGIGAALLKPQGSETWA